MTFNWIEAGRNRANEQYDMHITASRKEGIDIGIRISITEKGMKKLKEFDKIGVAILGSRLYFRSSPNGYKLIQARSSGKRYAMLQSKELADWLGISATRYFNLLYDSTNSLFYVER